MPGEADGEDEELGEAPNDRAGVPLSDGASGVAEIDKDPEPRAATGDEGGELLGD